MYLLSYISLYSFVCLFIDYYIISFYNILYIYIICYNMLYIYVCTVTYTYIHTYIHVKRASLYDYMLCLPCIVCKEATFPGHQNPHFKMEWYHLTFPPSKASSVHKDRSGAREATDCNRNGSVHGTHLFVAVDGCNHSISGSPSWTLPRASSGSIAHPGGEGGRNSDVSSPSPDDFRSVLQNHLKLFEHLQPPPTPSLSKRRHDLPFQAVSPQ